MPFIVDLPIAEKIRDFFPAGGCPEAPVQDHVRSSFSDLDSFLPQVAVHSFGKDVVELALFVVDQVIGGFVSGQNHCIVLFFELTGIVCLSAADLATDQDYPGH